VGWPWPLRSAAGDDLDRCARGSLVPAPAAKSDDAAFAAGTGTGLRMGVPEPDLRKDGKNEKGVIPISMTNELFGTRPTLI
jgi:hypothetical protein